MTSAEERLNKLLKVQEEMTKGLATSKEVANAIIPILKALKDQKNSLDVLLSNSESKKETARLEKQINKLENEIESFNSKLLKVKTVKGDKGERGEKGEKGDRGFIGEDGNDGSPDTAEDIRNKLELLLDDERLNVSAISGFADLEKGIIDRAISILDKRTQYLINKASNLQTQVNGLSAGGVQPLAYFISSQFNGVTSTFTVPSFSSILSFRLTGWPPNGDLQPTTDYTTPNSTSVALVTSSVSAPAAGTTGFILYIPS